MKDETLKLFCILGIFIGLVFISVRLLSLPAPTIPPDIPIIKTPKVIHYWFAKNGETYFVLKSFFDSKERNKFHNQVLNNSISNANFQYDSLYIINFSQQPKELSIGKIKGSTEKTTFENIDLENHIKNIADSNKLYFNTFSKPDILFSGHLKKLLVAFPSKVRLENIENIEIVESGTTYTFQKTQCLRSDFYEFIESPTISFFPTSQ